VVLLLDLNWSDRFNSNTSDEDGMDGYTAKRRFLPSFFFPSFDLFSLFASFSSSVAAAAAVAAVIKRGRRLL